MFPLLPLLSSSLDPFVAPPLWNAPTSGPDPQLSPRRDFRCLPCAAPPPSPSLVLKRRIGFRRRSPAPPCCWSLTSKAGSPRRAMEVVICNVMIAAVSSCPSSAFSRPTSPATISTHLHMRLAPGHRDLQPLGLHRGRRLLHARCGQWLPPGLRRGRHAPAPPSLDAQQVFEVMSSFNSSSTSGLSGFHQCPDAEHHLTVLSVVPASPA
jgi:hypothetical protein